ncbi:DUF5683 domain-containing protein [Ancylomarina longa]|uniref:DUF5683 domain-containing protein n=1 Tax=Ancylomarina longa TaxID=2487017 RepID=A0A434AXV1_9BACT|nr:DUF5683 domain-containing protein [Ancylomarina longa]RUT79344.1 hypothetical protein DLK05_03740 [Ancylomarina longa]
MSVILFCFNTKTLFAQHFTADTIQVESPVKVHSPHKATMYSLIFPGLGQIYNKKYWKVPILYAGIGATLYAINWNTKNFKKYKEAFGDFSQYYNYKYQAENLETPIEKPTSNSYEDLYNADFVESTLNFDNWFKTQLQNKKDSFKHDRDLSYIILAGVYVLNIIDAAVDAHFTNFNVNSDLTINVEPAVSYSAFSGNSVGFQCRITF